MFINLHVHSNYSHDCISKIDDIVKFAVDNNQNAIAVTDHGSMSGCVELYKKAKKAKIKPIIGCELYLCKPGQSAEDKSPANKTLNHLVVLAKNYTGYKNLLKITKLANINYYYKPRIDEQILFEHKDGLIVLNGHITTSLFDCLFFNFDGVANSSSIDEAKQYLYPDYEQRFLNIANKYKNVFGDDFYVEIQLFDKGDICQQSIGYILLELAKKHGFQAVGTGDAHYIYEKDAIFHKTFCAIKTNTKVKDLANIGYFNSGKYGIIDNKWAEKCYDNELIESTNEISSKIEEYDITAQHSIPKSDIANPRQFIYNTCIQRLKELGKENNQVYLDRLNSELAIIDLGNLYDYFIIVADYVRWAKSKNILVGPSRGSAGGCLISYLLKIISIDPIQYDLLMERFYSEDRAINKILPDIDSDFPASRREEIINYIRDKYGHNKVAGVVTFSTLQSKNALKDTLRMHSACTFQEINKITELIPSRDKISDKMAEFKEETGSDSVIEYCLYNDPDLLKDWCYLDENKNLCGDYALYFKIAIGLEGAIKAESKHASAIIIASRPIEECAPLIRDKSSDELIVALDMSSFEDVSLVKFDILGVKTLDCLTEVNNLLKEINIVDSFCH